MKYKTKAGVEVELHEQDMKAISKMYHEQEGEFEFEEMEEYFKELHKHAMAKMEHISHHIVTDEDSIDKAAGYVAKFGTYEDFVKFLRYEMDANVAYHLLESVK